MTFSSRDASERGSANYAASPLMLLGLPNRPL